MTVRKINMARAFEGRVGEEKYLSLTLEGVPICRVDLSQNKLPMEVLANGFHHHGGRDMRHEREISHEPIILGDVTVAKFFGQYNFGLMGELGVQLEAERMLLPEVIGLIGGVGRRELSAVCSFLSFENRFKPRTFATRPHLMAGGTFGECDQGAVIPGLTVGEHPSGEEDEVFYYRRDRVSFDPNWLACYVQNLRLPTSVQTD